ncbi:MAG: N-6 DNA methylase [Burkholderiaceae bacterium]|nr:N-6 DNA methylase [Burkholderiaceae bacterium]
MARKPVIDMSAWPSLSLEGNLIAPAMVAQIAAPGESDDTRAGYRVRKGLTIREEISTAFRVGQSHFDAFTRLENPSAEVTRRFIKAFLAETFGFDDLAPGNGVTAFIAGDRVPVVVVPPSEEKLDRRSPTLSVDRSRSPAFALQDYLNDHDHALWGLVTNGTLIRLMRDNASLTRPAYIEADLTQIFTNEDAASFAVLWLLIHRTRFGTAGTPATDCALERWRDAGAKEGEAARDKLAGQVEKALKILGSGFLEANPDLAKSLTSGEVNLTDWFNELLRLVYRLIFLMVAEDRNLLHPEKASTNARKLYAEGYSLAHLRAQCFRAATWDKHHDRFEGVKIVFRALADGQPALALPALGGLFAADRLPHLETARLRNRAFMEALYRLSWLDQKTGMVPVNWRAMETEELGSVYESLLELQPQLGDDGKTLLFASEAAEQKGNQRKTTGSYYTPDSLVQALLDTALDPVLDKTEAEADDPAKALLKLSVIDPACGSGHFLLAAARRIATRLARIRADGTPSLADFRHALRDVARSCLHGVDRNPMAVELSKVALWIETVDPGLPLGFFDAQIRCGDALLGVFDLKVLQDGIPDAAYKPLTGDDKETAKYYLKANRDAKAGQGGFDFGTGQASLPAMKPLALDFSGFRDLPEDTVEQIGAKAARFKELRKGQAFVRATAAANLYVAAFLLPKVGGAPAGASARTVPTTEELWLALNQGKIRQAMMDAPKAARRARAFHWPLEFPDVMQRGGFDVVLGNPPWEVMQVSDREFFSNTYPDIASLSGAARKKRIDDLQITAPKLYVEYNLERRRQEASNDFYRDSNRFPLCSQGKMNTFALFTELSFLVKSKRGRVGIIVPTGIAFSDATSAFFRNLIVQRQLISLFSFYETRYWFTQTDDKNSFCLLTLGSSDGDPEFVFDARPISDLLDVDRRFSLSAEEIAAINPDSGVAPIFKSRADAELAKKIFAPLFSLERPEEWLSLKQNVFSSSLPDDLTQFQDVSKSADSVAVFRGSFFHQYEVSSILGVHNEDSAAEPSDKYVSPAFYKTRMARKEIRPEYHLAIRRIARSSDVRTMIAAILPMVATDDTASVISVVGGVLLEAAALANLNSLVLDYTCGFKIGGTDIRKHNFSQLPFLPPSRYRPEHFAFITPKVLELTYTSHSLAPFARDLGHDGPPFAWDEDRRALLRADLDAFYARAYGLTRDELRYILDPADVKGPDYPSETFRVLKEKEIRQHGEYRTRRLVLAAWDRMEESGEFAAMGM